MKELKVAIKAAKESGKILQKYFNKNIKVNKKADDSPVTIADKESEKRIVSTIKKKFPNHNILAEENDYKKTDSGYKWIIDPLDGTRNFVRGISFFGNCIALEERGKIIVGVINMPAMNLFAYASSGNGAFINGRKVNVSRIKNIKDSFVSFGNIDTLRKDYDKQLSYLLRTCYSHRGFGDTLNYVLLAQGAIDIVLDFVYPWDVAAAKIIVEEAGGKLTDFNGANTIYGRNCIATNDRLHNEIVKIFNKNNQ